MICCRSLIVSLVLLMTPMLGQAAEPTTAKATIESFYQDYLPHTSMPENPVQPTLSRSFEKLIAENKKICSEKAGTDVCGWSAHGDPYLDSQEIDPKLSYETARTQVTEIAPGKIEVRLNVYPSYKDTEGYYDKVITYAMIQENGAWVIDDVIYKEEISARKLIRDENAYYLENPAPNAAVR